MNKYLVIRFFARPEAARQDAVHSLRESRRHLYRSRRAAGRADTPGDGLATLDLVRRNTAFDVFPGLLQHPSHVVGSSRPRAAERAVSSHKDAGIGSASDARPRVVDERTIIRPG